MAAQRSRVGRGDVLDRAARVDVPGGRGAGLGVRAERRPRLARGGRIDALPPPRRHARTLAPGATANTGATDAYPGSSHADTHGAGSAPGRAADPAHGAANCRAADDNAPANRDARAAV